MSGISTRIDKGTTRFAPKLKARPNRAKAATTTTAASENGTPAATPSIDGSDTGSFGASLVETDAGNSSNNGTATTSIIHERPIASGSITATTIAVGTSRRFSTTTSVSTALSSQNRSLGTPKSPVFSPTKVSKSQEIQTPSSSSASNTPKPAAIAIIPGVAAASSSKLSTAKEKVSIISLPSIRGRAASEDVSGEDEEMVDAFSPPRKKAATKSKYVRPKASRFGPEEPQLDEFGEEIIPDYSDTPMYEFVRDMGIGRRSKIFMEHQRIMEEKKRTKQQEKVRRIVEGREVSMTPGPGAEDDENQDEMEHSAVKKNEIDWRAKSESATPVSAPVKTFAPQVRVVNGRIELDMDSLTVDHAVVDAADHLEPLEYVDESAATRFTNSGSYSKRHKSQKWSEDETNRFYDALSQWGTDFGIICKIFPSKSRIAIRNKFKREDRINHARIQEALYKKTPIDLETYSQITQTVFPEVDESGFVKKPEGEDDEEEPLFDPNFDEEYGEEYGEEEVEAEEEIVEDGAEEIIGEIE
ncbi:Transcription factor TFIIIB component B [Linnemannia zychae]|nr:Transcription factor TFIIIB component B [Linnemannia zychae]